MRLDGLAVDDADDRKLDLSAHLGIELLDVDAVSRGNLVLLAARFHDCVHSLLLMRNNCMR